MPHADSEAELLATVERSPRAVAAHDRAAWVGLFTPTARVEDPVGSRPHVGTAAIERFHDTFIGPNTIVFRVEHDIVCGTTVFRDLSIAITMSTGVTLTVPMHLRYDLSRVAGEWRIAGLRAHWELPTMIGRLLTAGRAGLAAAPLVGARLIRHQGLGGTVGFARGFLRVGAAGKRAAVDTLAALGQGKPLSPNSVLEWPAGNPIGAGEFAARARGLEIGKTLAAGRFVTATVETPAGRGIAEIEVARRAGHIAAIRVYSTG
ncbi:nuclear transport factor 2 family protein [Nocardia sp. NPDC003482]